ncbi:MAG: hypothetical protein IKY68_03770 [Alistipes sp.]|nr:hypothetical protein [Alistipes sp.]
MATPIETNTEGLNEILNQVYNLPNRSSGSSEPDLVLYPKDNYIVAYGPKQNTVDFDQSQAVNVYKKVLAGEDVNVIISGRVQFNSYNRLSDATIHKASMVRVTEDYHWLTIDFQPCIYDYNSAGAAMLKAYQTTFIVDAESGTAQIDDTFSPVVGTI